MELEMKSRVYALPDDKDRVTRIEGQYTLPADLTGWTLIEEGEPCDRLNLAQTNYLPHPLLTHDGLYRYRLADGKIVERSEEELKEERAGLPCPEVQPTAKELMDAILELSQTIGG